MTCRAAAGCLACQGVNVVHAANCPHDVGRVRPRMNPYWRDFWLGWAVILIGWPLGIVVMAVCFD